MLQVDDAETQELCFPMQAEDLYILPGPSVDFDKVLAD